MSRVNEDELFRDGDETETLSERLERESRRYSRRLEEEDEVVAR